MFSLRLLHMDVRVLTTKQTYINQLCLNTGCCLEDLSKQWMIGMDGEKDFRNSVQSERLDDDDDEDDDDDIYELGQCIYRVKSAW